VVVRRIYSRDNLCYSALSGFEQIMRNHAGLRYSRVVEPTLEGGGCACTEARRPGQFDVAGK
jgi:hypothetical protein